MRVDFEEDLKTSQLFHYLALDQGKRYDQAVEESLLPLIPFVNSISDQWAHDLVNACTPDPKTTSFESQRHLFALLGVVY